MKLGILFSGGKDSCYAAYISKKEGYEIGCLITVASENKESYMFHTPSIKMVKKQAEVMGLPLIFFNTKGEKDKELLDLKKAIEEGIKKYNIKGVVSGAVESVYQSSNIQKICNELNMDCFNPLWKKNQYELLGEIIKNKFFVIITGVFAYPLNKNWLGRKIDEKFLQDIKELNEKYKINISGEGGEYESFVLNCGLFKRKLRIIGFKDYGEKNSWRRELLVK